jgi:anthranilate synthase/aminodeoxychorismate synthase-like glutamine amidotransferase
VILLVDNYDSFTYNIAQYVEMLGHRCKVIRNDATSISAIGALAPTHLLLSPGPGKPGDAGICSDVVREFAGRIPILGICLGHQVIGHVFGAVVHRARRPFHGKTSSVIHDGRGVYEGMASPFVAARYHSLVIDPTSLPAALEVSSTTEDGTIMGVRHRELPIEGVQFHPESVATVGGMTMLANFFKSLPVPAHA